MDKFQNIHWHSTAPLLFSTFFRMRRALLVYSFSRVFTASLPFSAAYRVTASTTMKCFVNGEVDLFILENDQSIE